MPAPCLSPYECRLHSRFCLPPHLQLREDGGGDDQGRPLPVCLPGLVVLGPVADDPAASLVLDQRAAQPQLTQGALPEGGKEEGSGGGLILDQRAAQPQLTKGALSEGERRGWGGGKRASPQSEPRTCGGHPFTPQLPFTPSSSPPSPFSRPQEARRVAPPDTASVRDGPPPPPEWTRSTPVRDAREDGEEQVALQGGRHLPG